VCKAFEGLTQLVFNHTLPKFVQALQSSLDNAKQECKQPLVFFNSGLHDFAAANFSFPQYEYQLKRTLTFIQAMLAGHVNGPTPAHCLAPVPPPRLLWVSTTRKAKYYKCKKGVGLNAVLGNPGVKVLNAVAARVCRALDVPVLDMFRVSQGMQDDKGDGHHCENKFHFWYANDLKNYFPKRSCKT